LTKPTPQHSIIVCGVDRNWGRGALFSPVVAAAVLIYRRYPFVTDIKDGKQLSADRGNKLAEKFGSAPDCKEWLCFYRGD